MICISSILIRTLKKKKKKKGSWHVTMYPSAGETVPSPEQIKSLV